MSNDVEQLDLKAASRWMSENVEGFEGPVTAEKFAVGQSNPTFRLTGPRQSYVLRRKPPGILLKSAHAVEREYRVQKALAGSGVPVPKMYALCEDDSVIGSAFYVMEDVKGRNINDPSMPDLAKDQRGAIIDEMGRVLAAIHDVDIEAVGLSDYGPTGNYYRRQIDRWSKQYRASETETITAMEELMSWLDANIPPDDGQRRLVHGDYRIDNMLFATDGPSCKAVLDWELSTIGHPYADLAGVIMQWQMPVGADGRGLAGIDRNAQGLPSDDDFVATYCARRGLDGIEGFGFYVAFCFFRMAAILQGVKKRALDGNASNPERALKVGAYVPSFAKGGLKSAHKT
ncbi:phosphotransferase family protein [Actibacterium lipolyticum]|uniref:Putative aminoglycoside phosphotransferase n=1 Tax=Actibacterium lipolyticum TaxID=1524263 RepID=A0A238KQE2_9RHOB|nr:phosphotransferase family protein [Actibacterium lipolyticum]SMX44246.1 Putative aminoglycoside phosphotransferase [Actibacterium lipolyticum]